MRKITVVTQPRKRPQVQPAQVLSATEQQLRAELRARLYTACLISRLQRAV